MEDSALKLTDCATAKDVTNYINGTEVTDNKLIIYFDDGSKPLTKAEKAKLERERIKRAKEQIKSEIAYLKQELKRLRGKE